jgi:ATP-dependent RNA helicase SUPV3L1/SUV3
MMKQTKKKKKRDETKRKSASRSFKEQIAELVNDRIQASVVSYQSSITIHVGPTNSGKTYNALQDLRSSQVGCFLAPLRLLANEVFHTFNLEYGVPCSLVTGEEKILVRDARITSSTVEMFSPDKEYDCVVLDETQMLADENRGNSWLRVLLLCKSKRLHIITSYEALFLIKRLLKKLDKIFEVKEYKRLVPLKMSETTYKLSAPIDRTIYVVFSRSDVLMLKEQFEKLGKKVSVVYGNLPPEVRRRQIERFKNCESDVCIATDAIGMGVNLPADRVCFVKTTKFDGNGVRPLNNLEIKQIAGRAGRFKLCEFGEVSALDPMSLSLISEALESPVEPLEFAKISPELEDLMVFNDKLLHTKMVKWSKLVDSVPVYLLGLVDKVDLSDQLGLASYFNERDQEVLGLENVFKLIKAPVRKDSSFWWKCVDSILNDEKLPVPDTILDIRDDQDLQEAEQLINDCEIYAWINNCTDFGELCEDLDQVTEIKHSIVERVDKYLVRVRKNKFKKSVENVDSKSSNLSRSGSL